MDAETWKSIPGYEGVYSVSDRGSVRRDNGGRGSVAGRVLTPKRATNGYLHVDLSIDGQKTRFGTHRLVALAFIGPPPSSAHVVNHRDGDKRNNTPGNLEWCTPAENNAHARAAGLVGAPVPLRGEHNGRSKLTAAQVAEIRALKGSAGQREIAASYGIARTMVQRIHQGRAWTEWPSDLRVREFPR